MHNDKDNGRGGFEILTCHKALTPHLTVIESYLPYFINNQINVKMKTIKEAATEHAESCWNNPEWEPDRFSTFETFNSGVVFAQQWIGFEKELPPVMLEVIVKDSSNKKRKRVFQPLDNGDIKYLAETFTHWRPVERV